MPPDRNERGDGGLTVCPACDGRLIPRELACKDCGLVVQTRFKGNEFVGLDDDNLHLLRIFVACEGRIRDMERALGVSYPTVKSRLARLRRALGTVEPVAETPDPPRDEPPRRAARRDREGPAAVLDRLEAGEIDFEEALQSIKRVSQRDR
ncbi:MAG: DUF2089 family protein [Gammaproteobacteria bacterium]|nr:DUF2089 family protein [Gammaproteobacteria bacterium]